MSPVNSGHSSSRRERIRNKSRTRERPTTAAITKNGTIAVV